MDSFIWDAKTLHYSDQDGLQVSRAEIRDAVRAVGEETAKQMENASRDFSLLKINRQAWELKMEDLIRLQHRTVGVIARGGFNQMTAADWGKIGNAVRDQYDYLRAFERQIERGEIDPASPSFLTRAKSYANAGQKTYENVYLWGAIKAGLQLARRVLTPGAKHCDECPELAAEGFIPAEDITPIGETECNGGCACEIEFATEEELAAA